MAKNQGIIRLRGTIDGVTYVEGQNGRRSRSKSSLDKEKMDGNSKYNYFRLLQQELKLYSKYGALMRSGVKIELKRVKPYRGVQRLNKILNQVKNLDTTSQVGSRNVSLGLDGDQGKALLTNFDFYGKSTVNDTLDKPIAIDETTGVITLSNFNPMEEMIYPSNATHVQFKSQIMDLDGAELLEQHTQSNVVYLPINGTPNDVVLTPTSLPAGGDHRFYLLQILFYLEINGYKELIGTDAAVMSILKIE